LLHDVFRGFSRENPYPVSVISNGQNNEKNYLPLKDISKNSVSNEYHPAYHFRPVYRRGTV
jgi:hypothetical protein